MGNNACSKGPIRRDVRQFLPTSWDDLLFLERWAASRSVHFIRDKATLIEWFGPKRRQDVSDAVDSRKDYFTFPVKAELLIAMYFGVRGIAKLKGSKLPQDKALRYIVNSTFRSAWYQLTCVDDADVFDTASAMDWAVVIQKLMAVPDVVYFLSDLDMVRRKTVPETHRDDQVLVENLETLIADQLHAMKELAAIEYEIGVAGNGTNISSRQWVTMSNREAPPKWQVAATRCVDLCRLVGSWWGQKLSTVRATFCKLEAVSPRDQHEAFDLDVPQESNYSFLMHIDKPVATFPDVCASPESPEEVAALAVRLQFKDNATVAMPMATKNEPTAGSTSDILDQMQLDDEEVLETGFPMAWTIEFLLWKTVTGCLNEIIHGTLSVAAAFNRRALSKLQSFLASCSPFHNVWTKWGLFAALQITDVSTELSFPSVVECIQYFWPQLCAPLVDVPGWLAFVLDDLASLLSTEHSHAGTSSCVHLLCAIQLSLQRYHIHAPDRGKTKGAAGSAVDPTAALTMQAIAKFHEAWLACESAVCGLQQVVASNRDVECRVEFDHFVRLPPRPVHSSVAP
ncbi:hypothetical protein DYB32_000557 [Aphanomyces invadans]|uniref:Uncharacterized protein n=1 Tax=Aphanomyces invadans TaxID=157072 RepID=A0A418B9M3_9STRA|nr:hypothetical protein DYB32_000557 [Aphanomyces invadans]